MASRFRLTGTPQDSFTTLEIRGLSRGSVIDRKSAQGGLSSFDFPLSGHRNSPDSESNNDDESTIRGGSSEHEYFSPRVPLAGEDLTVSESSHYWSGANSSTTGNTTERSSLYSWGDDVLDHKTSRDVQEMFQAIERMLFESVLSGSSLIQQECREWMDAFPHLRVKGKQALNTKDEGYQSLPASNVTSGLDTPTYEPVNTELDAIISLTGTSVTPMLPPVDNDVIDYRTTSQQVTPLTYLHEEIFEEDGEVEEYLAYDIREMDEEDTVKRYHVPRRRRLGYPPITPNACVRDAVINQLFDSTWVKLISCLNKVKVGNEVSKKSIRSLWKILFDSYGAILRRMEGPKAFDEQLPYDSDEQMGHHYAYGGSFFEDRHPGLLMSQSDHFPPPSREFGDNVVRHGRLSGRYPHPKSDFTSLNSVMMIRRKELLVRSDRPNGGIHNEAAMEISTPSLERSVVFPRGSGSRLQLPGTSSPQIYNQFLPMSVSRQTSAKHRGRGKPFQPPKLQPLIDRAKTPSAPGNRDWTIKGKNMPLSSLGMANLDEQSEVVGIHVTSPASPPPTAPAFPGGSLYHHSALPPLPLQSLHENASAEFGRISRRANRISSAVPEDTGRQNRRGWDGALRPNTTHAFRNDGTPKQRALSITPSNFSSRPSAGRTLQPINKSLSPTGFGPVSGGNLLYSQNYSHSPDGHQHYRGLAGIHGVGMMSHTSTSHSPHDPDDDGRQLWGNPVRRRQVMGN